MNKEALKTAIALTLGLFISQFFQLPHGYWILVTIAIIYLAGSVTGLKMEKMNKRILGSFVGLVLGILFMECLGYFDYRILYLVPLTWFFMFYFYFISNNYTYMAVFVSIMLLFSIAILSPENADWNIYNTAYSRIICTVIGVLIMVISEYFFFYDDSRADKKIHPEFKKLIMIMGNLADELIKLFQDDQVTSEEFREKYFELFDELYKLHLLIRAAAYEPTNDHNRINLYNTMCNDLYSAMDYMREAMFITTHKTNELKHHPVLLEEIRFYFIREFNLEKSESDFEEIIKTNKKAIFNNRGNTEYYFLQSLYRMNKYLLKIKAINKLIAFD
jgi:uncharacterized membrane protein YgaE (UPF0421/DUF939 family)